MFDEIYSNIGIIIAGIAGGAVALIQAARKRKKSYTILQVAGSLFVSAFAAWVWSMMTSQFEVADGIRVALAGIAGMSADKVLDLMSDRFISGGAR